MNWKSKKVLVTGAGGFVGSHLSEQLVRVGASVRSFVHYNSFGFRGHLDTSEFSNEIDFFAGDITDSDCVLEAVKGVDIVFHLAALIGIPYSYIAPDSYLRTNVSGTLNILNAVKKLGIERVVHTSTSEVYGTALYVPIDEKHPLQGQSPYSASKIGADKMAEAYYCSFSTPVVTLRPFNTFGPRQSARAVIPTIISQLLSGKRVLKLGSLTTMRDMNYVENSISAYIKAAECANIEGKVINVGSAREISIGDLAYLIADIIGVEISIESDNKRIRPEKSEVNRLLADTTIANKILNWTPKVTLEEGLKRTVDWLKENLESYRPDEYCV